MEAVLVTFLAPLLPYLLKKGEQVADRAIDAVGEAAWDRAKSIWSSLRPSVDADEAASQAARAVASDPKDEAAKGALQFQFRNLLNSDPGLNHEVGRLLEKAKLDGVIADNGAVVIGGDVSADRGGVAAGRDISGGVRTGGGA
jgi:hypothetical protein